MIFCLAYLLSFFLVLSDRMYKNIKLFCPCLPQIHSFATTALHNLHATAHVHATATSTTLAGRRVRAIKSASGLSLMLFALGVPDSAIDRKNCYSGLGGSS